MREYFLLCLAILAISGCASAGAARRLMEEASRTEFGSAPYCCADTIAVAKVAGHDYGKIVNDCLAKDKEAMHILFWLTKHAGFDAASAQGNAAVLGQLLQQLGDQFFSECLDREPVDIREAVRGDIAYALMTVEESSPIECREFRTEFPLTYAICFTVAERVEYFVYSCRREVHQWQPDFAVGDLGMGAVPVLLSMMNDRRKVWVRIGPPQGGPESSDVDVKYLYGDDEGPRNSIAEFALLCICRIREPHSGTSEDFNRVWAPVLHEFTDYDGRVTDEVIDEIRTWYNASSSKSGD
ncbi:MAG: hypothetical protein NTU88_12725 [Armatimonadetes bacterium]|nr:hypothetical protein [Armatimonadota bacterium]